MGIKLVVFDMDGTLVDTMSIYADYAASLIEKNYGMDYDKARFLYLDTSGLPFNHQIEQIFPNNSFNLRVSDMFEDWKKSILQDNHMLRSGAADAIRELLSHGIIVCISSNNLQENVDKIVKRWEVKVNAALGYRYDGFQKGTAHFEWFEEKFGFDRSQMKLIGDSLNDYKLASDAEVPFAALTWTFENDLFHSLDKDIPCFSDFASINQYIFFK